MRSKIWAEINLKNLEHNYRQIRKNIGEVDFLSVVKANAYGHGVSEIALELVAVSRKYIFDSFTKSVFHAKIIFI